MRAHNDEWWNNTPNCYFGRMEWFLMKLSRIINGAITKFLSINIPCNVKMCFVTHEHPFWSYLDLSSRKVYKRLFQCSTFNYLLSPSINTLGRPSKETVYRFPVPPNRCGNQQTHVSVLLDGPCVKNIVVKDQSFLITICWAALYVYSPAKKKSDDLATQVWAELLVLGTLSLSALLVWFKAFQAPWGGGWQSISLRFRDVFKKQRFCHCYSAGISLVLQYSPEWQCC
jgi:hypothetical protein